MTLKSESNTKTVIQRHEKSKKYVHKNYASLRERINIMESSIQTKAFNNLQTRVQASEVYLRLWL